MKNENNILLLPFLLYCADSFNLSEPIVRNLIKTSKPYVPTKYDIKHNRNKATGIIVYKISKQDYYERK